MKIILSTLLMAVSLITNSNCIYAQTNDTDLIIEARKISNLALRNFDYNQYYSYLIEDVHYTTSNGTLMHGLENLKKYVSNVSGEKMYWIRTPDEIEINSKLDLAWEKGQWKGYTLNSREREIIKGNYAAIWTKASGSWKIKSQLFFAVE